MEKPVGYRYPPVSKATDDERIGMVKEIFSTITGKYDFLNRLLSLRRDVAWRRFLIKKMSIPQAGRALDVACGTGDLSIGIARKYPGVVVTGVDFVYEMVATGAQKAQRKGFAHRIRFIEGDALRLPFRDDCFDVTTMAFGIRNIPDKLTALKEMVRVTAPGGQIMILEMTFIENRLFKFLYYIYLNYLLPVLAGLFSTNRGAYYYLADSIMHFPAPDAFAGMMEEAGMTMVKKYPLTCGVTWLHAGQKKEETNEVQSKAEPNDRKESAVVLQPGNNAVAVSKLAGLEAGRVSG
ncbi:MAG TPA: ubiquinone/menaquinone biosynthesis methyltransferase [Syntrophorhabdaceae bacterium]|nr:ubiquinone/menaquinone biosynthesis methyltransferase [Syntrophorhabdaceae bacterium]